MKNIIRTFPPVAQPATDARRISQQVLSGVAAAVVCGLGVAVTTPALGDHEGLPFTETFDDAHLSDAAKTRADWATSGQLRLPTAPSLSPIVSDPSPPTFFPAVEDVGGQAFTTRELKLADMNGDGHLDLVEGNAEANQVYLNDGAGNYLIGMPITGDVANTRGLAVGDMDGDGDLDVVVGNLRGRVRLYLNSGDGVQFVGSDVSEGDPPVDDLLVADIDGDGHLDVVTATHMGSPSRIYFHSGDPLAPFGAAGIPGERLSSIGQNVIPTEHSQEVLAGDIDNDGDIDLVLINEDEVNSLYRNEGNRTFSRTPIGIETDNSQGGALGDLNGDGYLDLVVGNYDVDQTSKIYFNNPNGADPFEGVIPVDLTQAGNPSEVHHVALGDVNNDGHLDVVLSTAFPEDFPGGGRFTNRLLLNDGDGSGGFSTMLDIGTEIDVTNITAIGDVDGDGDADIVAGNEGRDALNDAFAFVNRLYRNEGTPDGTPVLQLSGTATSVRVDDETGEIPSVALTVEPADIGLHNEAEFWVSSNGGAAWMRIAPGGAPVVFPAGIRGSDLRWRVDMNSLSPAAGSAQVLAFDSVTLSADAPTFTSTPVTEATVGDTYTYEITTSDPNAGDTLTLEASTPLPGWLTLTDNGDGTGTLTGIPTEADLGAHAVALEVRDAVGSVTNQQFTVTVAGANVAPTFTSTPIGDATEGIEYLYTAMATDADGAVPPLLSAIVLPAWLTLTDNGDGTAALIGTPAAADVGAHAVEIEAVDDDGATAVQAFSITVAAAAVGGTNTAPVFTSTPLSAATEGTAYSYSVTSEDADAGDTLTLTGTLPAWLTLTDGGDGAGTLSGTPAAAHVGNHDVVLQLTDSDGATAEQSFTIAVAAAPPPPAPTPTPAPQPSNDSGGGGGAAGLGELLGLAFLGALLGRRRLLKKR